MRYQAIWKKRCYFDGIPDEVPAKVQLSFRAPSWKAVAMAILKNDHGLRTLGFIQVETQLSAELLRHCRPVMVQLDLFGGAA
jgi:predicted phosphoadenosine phosphosulfate sulfurtransferase